MDIWTQMAEKIIREQEIIIGPIAIEQAKKVDGLEVSNGEKVKITGNAKDVLQKLVDQYARLFGRASIEVCRDAVKSLLPDVQKDQVPQILL